MEDSCGDAAEQASTSFAQNQNESSNDCSKFGASHKVDQTAIDVRGVLHDVACERGRLWPSHVIELIGL
jgi:homoaconitase/3-isopropylmalate dehydratase large subunit